MKFYYVEIFGSDYTKRLYANGQIRIAREILLTLTHAINKLYNAGDFLLSIS